MQRLRDVLGFRAVAITATTVAAIGVLAVSKLTGSPVPAVIGFAFAAFLALWRLSLGNGFTTRSTPSQASHAAAAGNVSWRSIVDAITDPAIVLSGDGRVLHNSPAARELFPNLALGQPIGWVSRAPELLQAVEQALEVRNSRTVETLERVPVERRLAVTISPLDGAARDAIGPALLLVFRDVSEEERLAQMRSDFIANASHELRTPLTSLRGFIETLQGQARADPEARAQFLDIMSSQAGRMSRLLDDLLSLSRVEMRAHVPPRGEVEINEMVREVTDLLQPLAKEADIALALEPASAPCWVRGDRDELVQVFQNLAQNALKYGRGGGHVHVRITREPGAPGGAGRVLVEVSDDGPGIAEEHLPRLTERFYRVDVAASREKGGTGLGLAIVKHVLNRHNGQLRVQSKLGSGSAFTVSLNLIEERR